MVNGLPKFNHDGVAAVCEICMNGKKNRESIPKKSLWEASHGPQLIHGDIWVRSLPPQKSENWKHVHNQFIDDFSRKHSKHLTVQGV